MKRRSRRVLAIFGVLAALTCVAFWTSNIVHVRRAEVIITDLPAQFNGTTILYVTDIDLVGTNTASRAARVFRKLEALSPDLLLLGGDYVSRSLFEVLNGTEVNDPSRANALFDALSDFDAPLGKFAICGDNDGSSESLAARLSGYGITGVDGKIASVQRNGAELSIVGIDGSAADVSQLASTVQSGQCVIALSHSPSRIIDIRVAEASDGGAWADLVLCGHTHGGQIILFDRTVLQLNEIEHRFISGWQQDDHMSMLVSSGFGCEALNLRLGTQSEVWLITLRCRPTGMIFQ